MCLEACSPLPFSTVATTSPVCSPQSGYHRVTKVAKNASIANKAENCIDCTSACPTLPCGVETQKQFFGSKNNNKRFLIFDPKKTGVQFFNIL